jgi:prepilin-type N-terminal cleavage/methylation domain-containing protein
MRRQRRTMNDERGTNENAFVHRSSFIVHRSAPAFTLVEVVAAMAIVSILLLAISGALSFSIRATTGQGAVEQTHVLGAADVADQVADDLHVAMNFSERTSTSVAFTVPDRKSVGTPNQVRYAWDGVSVHSLYRQFMPAASPALTASNATYTPVELLPGVTNFNLNYLFRSMGTPAVTDGVLASHDAALLGSMSNQAIDSTHWISQYVPISVPLGQTSFTITRVLIYANAASLDGILRVRIYTASSGKPATLIEEESLNCSALSSAYEWVEVPLSSVTNRTDAGVCIVIGYRSGSTTLANVQYESALLSILSGWQWSTSSDGSTWGSTSTTKCLRLYVYGTTQ